MGEIDNRIQKVEDRALRFKALALQNIKANQRLLEENDKLREQITKLSVALNVFSERCSTVLIIEED